MNLSQSLNELMNAFFSTYNGCLIEKHKGKYITLSKEFDSLELAHKYIDESIQSFRELALKQKLNRK